MATGGETGYTPDWSGALAMVTAGVDVIDKVTLTEPLSQFPERLTLLEFTGSGGRPSGGLLTGVKAGPQKYIVSLSEKPRKFAATLPVCARAAWVQTSKATPAGIHEHRNISHPTFEFFLRF
jgi:hypothetical protein